MNAQSRQMSPSLLWRGRMAADPAVKMIIAHTITKVNILYIIIYLHIFLSFNTVKYSLGSPIKWGHN